MSQNDVRFENLVFCTLTIAPRISKADVTKENKLHKHHNHTYLLSPLAAVLLVGMLPKSTTKILSW